MSKSFLITVDTEGDNLWNQKEGQVVTTNNAAYIPRFQELCEKFGFIPTYLTNYEMATDKRWVDYGKKKQRDGLCEIGLHIHAWNSPPDYLLRGSYNGNAYITEYPDEVVQEKISFLTNLLSNQFECTISSARSGRWATNASYFEALLKENITVDCSVTPQIDFTNVPGATVGNGPSYLNSPIIPYVVHPGVIEIPMTTRLVKWAAEGSIKHKVKSLIIGDRMWLRPIKLSKAYLQAITDAVIKENSDYLEFMIHSSELMPGGSPYIKTEEEAEQLFELMDWYFKYVTEKGFTGSSLTDYAQSIEGILK